MKNKSNENSKLKLIEAQLRSILESTNDFIILRDENCLPLYYNNAYSKMIFDLLGQEMNPDMKPNLLHPDKNVGKLWEGFFARVLSGEKFTEKLDFVEANNRTRYFEHSFNPIFDEDQVIGFSEFTHEITEYINIQNRLKESEEKYRGIFDESVTSIYIFDSEKNFVDSNQAGLEFLGYSKEELLSLSILDVDADHVAVIPAHNQLLSGGKIVNFEHRLVRKDGRVITVLNNSRALTNSNGETIGILSTLVDITERKQVEKALKESEEKFRLLAESVNASIVIINREASFLYANPETTTLTGYSPEELLKIKYHQLIEPTFLDDILERVSALLNREVLTDSLETVLYSKDGVKIHILTSSNYINYKGQDAILVVSIDITEQKTTEETILKLKAERENQAIEIAGGIAHEVLNAMFPLNSKIYQLKEQLVKNNMLNDQEIINIFDVIDISMTKVTKLTESVKDISQVKARGRKDKTNVKDVIVSILDEKKGSFDEDIVIDISKCSDVVIEMRKIHAFSLFDNIISNSIDALGYSDLKMITISTDIDKKNIRILITDTGYGIPSDKLETVFEPFYSTKPTKGTGLGLSLCKKIVENYSGTISVESKISNGASFLITLPNIL